MGKDNLLDACMSGISWTCDIDQIEKIGDTLVVEVVTDSSDPKKVARAVFNFMCGDRWDIWSAQVVTRSTGKNVIYPNGWDDPPAEKLCMR